MDCVETSDTRCQDRCIVDDRAGDVHEKVRVKEPRRLGVIVSFEIGFREGRRDLDERESACRDDWLCRIEVALESLALRLLYDELDEGGGIRVNERRVTSRRGRAQEPRSPSRDR